MSGGQDKSTESKQAPGQPEAAVVRRRARKHPRRHSDANDLDPMALKEGELDPETGYKIAHLIGAYETCIIYLDDANNLHYWSTREHEWPDEAAFAAIESEATYLRTAAGPHLNQRDRYQTSYITGEAIAFALESHDFIGAKNALARARELLGQAQRIRVVLTTLGLVTFSVVAASAVWLCRNQIQQQFGTWLFEGLLCALAGGVGAALSIMQRTGQLPLPVTAWPFADLLECIARYAIGTTAGVMLYLGISANLFLGIVNKIDNASSTNRGALLLGLALSAGVSERAFPKLVRSFEKQTH
jgi:hypothetical protein